LKNPHKRHILTDFHSKCQGGLKGRLKRRTEALYWQSPLPASLLCARLPLVNALSPPKAQIHGNKPPFSYHIVLHEPLIPPNTGNAGRLCVATGSKLHLIEPLGFSLGDKQVRRSGLDYWKHVNLSVYPHFEQFLEFFRQSHPKAPIFLIEDHPHIQTTLYDVPLPQEAAFVFGKETKGLPESLLSDPRFQPLKIPMFSEVIRSLNLSNAVALTLYEAIRQNRIPHSETKSLKS
jgi:tRNA (cytidine/uridine-2'-O-)-methyltransferase